MRCSAVPERGWDQGEPSPSPAATASSPFCCLTATSSPGRGKSFKGRALGRTGRFRPYRSTARRSQPIAGKLSALAKASPFRERWHGEAVTERVDFRDEPLPSFRFAKCHLPRRWRPWQRGQVSSSFVNGRRSQPISEELPALAKASPFRERWHGEAVTERVEPPPSAILCPAERPAYSRSTSIPIVFSLFSYFIIEMMFAQVN